MNDVVPHNVDIIVDHVRQHDPDRYLATLFAPADQQPHLFALYAFNAEIARVRSLVREPAMGEIRFQWWRDVLGGERGGEARDNPVAAALLATMRAHKLPARPLVDLVDARTFDLYDDPMPTWLDLEGYAGETSSSLIRLAMLILGNGEDRGGADAAGHGGVAYALTGLLRAMPWTSRRGQVYLPLECLDAHRVTPAAIRRGEDSPGLRAALAEVRQRARVHLDQTRLAAGGVDRTLAPALVPLALLEPYLAIMERRAYAPYASEIDLGKLGKLARLWRAARRGAP